MAQLSSKKEIFIHAPPESVWRIHTDINGWGEWQPGIANASSSSPLAVGGVFRWKSGGLPLTSTIQVLEANHRIAWAGKTLGTEAHHAWTFTPQDGGTLVTTEEVMSGWLLSLLKVLSPHFLDRSLDVWLQALKAKAEAKQM